MRVLAIAVTFNPDLDLLSKVLRSVAQQVQGVVVVDNASGDREAIATLASELGAEFLANPQNIGLAAAQNQGILRARQGGFSHVLLLDQDTVLSPGVVVDLATAWADLTQDYGAIAAIGPVYVDLHSGRPTQTYRSSGPRLIRTPVQAAEQPVESEFIIASGSLITTSAFDTVGMLNEDLFIDLVDVEWCLRARALGFRSFVLPTRSVDHHLGSGVLTVGQRQIAVHAPVRDYYWVRNALWLARQPYTPLAWKAYLVRRSLLFLAAYTTIADQRAVRLKMMAQGIADSFGGRFGPLKRR